MIVSDYAFIGDVERVITNRRKLENIADTDYLKKMHLR